MCLLMLPGLKNDFSEQEDFATTVSLPPLSLSVSYSESPVNFFFFLPAYFILVRTQLHGRQLHMFLPNQ